MLAKNIESLILIKRHIVVERRHAKERHMTHLWAYQPVTVTQVLQSGVLPGFLVPRISKFSERFGQSGKFTVEMFSCSIPPNPRRLTSFLRKFEEGASIMYRHQRKNILSTEAYRKYTCKHATNMDVYRDVL